MLHFQREIKSIKPSDKHPTVIYTTGKTLIQQWKCTAVKALIRSSSNIMPGLLSYFGVGLTRTGLVNCFWQLLGMLLSLPPSVSSLTF